MCAISNARMTWPWPLRCLLPNLCMRLIPILSAPAKRSRGFRIPIRLKVLCVLGDREMAVNDLAAACETSQSNISQHLSILRQCGILATRKEANFVHYRINDPRMIELMNLMRDMFCSQPH